MLEVLSMLVISEWWKHLGWVVRERWGKGARFDPRNYMAPMREWATLAWMSKCKFLF